MLDSIKGLPVQGAESPLSTTTPPSETAPEHLALSLKSVLDRLPVALKPLATRAVTAEEKFNVPTARVLPQLATGAVRITFDELRAAAPAGLFSVGGPGDVLVDLPLPEVLRVAGPLLKRKPAQQAQAAPGSFFTGPGPTPPAKPAPAPVPMPLPTPSAPAFAPAFQPASETPKGGTAFTTFQPTRVEPAPVLAPTFAPVGAAPASSLVPVKLSVLTVGWPENIRKEAADLGDVTVEFPREDLGNAMKGGKVSFTWGQLRSWMKPAVGPSLFDSTALLLPLRVLVQPFMSNMKSGAKPAAEGQPTHFLNRAAPIELTAPVAPPAAPGPVDTRLGEALGKPEKAHWTPTEIIHAVTAFPGVLGAMLSLQEGQLAAAEMQATLPPELLAYAVPKLFSVTGDQARQMKLGDPTVVSLVADSHHWAVFKLEKIFFTVMSRKGQMLPLPQLQTIATEIARQRK